MLRLPGNNIAFVFSDQAGANACFALARICQAENKTSVFLFSNKRRIGFDAMITDHAPDFKKLGIDCVFTGTSHPDSSNHFEVDCIRRATSQKIFTISFIDHWTNFKLRFEGLNISQYPDEIWVVDETAKKLAVAEGLPAEKLFIRQNPYHYYLKNYWHPQYTNKNYLDVIGIPKSGVHILFAPDPLSIRNGKSLVGFDEREALEDLVSILSQRVDAVRLIIKCHPLQPINELQELIRRNDWTNCFLIKEADPLELINASDLVTGFYSNILLEANVMGKEVIRYYPGNPETDLLKHKENLTPLHTKMGLQKAINAYLGTQKVIQ